MFGLIASTTPSVWPPSDISPEVRWCNIPFCWQFRSRCPFRQWEFEDSGEAHNLAEEPAFAASYSHSLAENKDHPFQFFTHLHRDKLSLACLVNFFRNVLVTILTCLLQERGIRSRLSLNILYFDHRSHLHRRLIDSSIRLLLSSTIADNSPLILKPKLISRLSNLEIYFL